MANGNNIKVDLLSVTYSRPIETIVVELTDDNYTSYGYKKDDNGYYKYDVALNENVYATEVYFDRKGSFSHTLPNPSSFAITYSDIDRSGSGRDENGNVVRDRMGHYMSIDVTWDIVENSAERRDLVKILRNTPPIFTLAFHDSDNKADEIKLISCYHGDIKENLYLFMKDNQIWKGLATTFIQSDITPYDDTIEPILEVIE